MSDEMAKRQQEQEEKLFREDSDHEDEREGDQTESTRWERGRESDQNEQTGSGEQGRGDQEDEESDSEEEESDQEDEESDSEEEETEEDESKPRGKTSSQESRVDQKQKSDRSFNEENNHKFETNQRPPGSIRMGLLNVHSLNKKTAEIKELITKNNLDVFLPTETWLKRKGGRKVLGAASPENFSSFHQVRATRDTFNVKQVRKSRGGGVAIQYSQVLQGGKIKLTKKAPETFEYVAAVLQNDEWAQPVLLINVYRPPTDLKNLTQFHRFLDEFQKLLDEVSEDYNSIIVTGDFNIWVDNDEKSSTAEFQQLLGKNHLVQHVKDKTHKGHTLDLVITRDVGISRLFVRDDGISDHYTVYFTAKPMTKDAKEKDKEKDDEEEKANESEL